MSIEGAQIILSEMRHSFDTAYSSARKYTTKTFTVFGAELTLLLFYLSGEELNAIKSLFIDCRSGWCFLAVAAFLSFVSAAVLFILTLATDKKWSFPPDEYSLIKNKQYQQYDQMQIITELIEEYNNDIAACVKKFTK